ncbi:uncharacterized protein LOC131927839 [Physella acuta]|uniref:uncharacterized protein LOC131927839 n=1 Tax=Physella acuta TaxID=109671 RepID=UPI0027DBC9DD|nr:uncharacterized protein LOC131927839 [Physella acuta]XP_059139681.1 uncharacterized protein LOC131927839 [Physella acuta]XP_059139682.1 uncharacterized protein LOC131927839 [Physella acuta]
MSNSLETVEVEGEELVGDADMSEWTILFESDESKRNSRILSRKSSREKSSSKTSSDKQKTASSQSRNIFEASASNLLNDSSNSVASKLEPETDHKSKQPDNKRTHNMRNENGSGLSSLGILSKGTEPSTGDLPENLDKLKHPDDQKDGEVPGNQTDGEVPAKVQKLENESDILMAIDGELTELEDVSKQVEDKDETITNVKFLPSLTEDDFRNIDNYLVEEMMEDVRQQMMPRMGDKFIVQFSPVELADLAEVSVQKLLETQPNLAFYFKRQGKFKKKKGYAESYFSKSLEVQSFIQQLIETKLIEKRCEVTITYCQGKKSPDILSFVLWLDKTEKLHKLIKTAEEPNKAKPEVKEFLQIEKVPSSISPLLIKTVFPFTKSIVLESNKCTGEYKGPYNIFYPNHAWIEALLDCCTDYIFKSLPINIIYKRKQPEAKPSLPVTTELASVDNSNKDQITSAAKKSPKPTDIDEDISSMTLDVCSGMLESLNKLKKLGTDNPSVLKILEMQSQLALLQQSLSDTKKSTAGNSAEEPSDPWTVGPSDTETTEHSADQFSEEMRREEEYMVKRQQQEMEDLQRRIREAGEGEMEEGIKEGIDSELEEMLAGKEEILADGGDKSEPRACKQETREITGGGKAQEKTTLSSKSNDGSALTEKAGETPEARPITPGRTLNNGVPVYSEQEYSQMLTSKTSTQLPSLHYIQLAYFPKRQCPVEGCPATKLFKTEASFQEHWNIFHEPNITMRFCLHCSAYFMNNPELESHLAKRHSLSEPDVVQKLLSEARVKVVSNPSFRDPGHFLSPFRQ